MKKSQGHLLKKFKNHLSHPTGANAPHKQVKLNNRYLKKIFKIPK